MRRRAVLEAGFALAAWLTTSAHTPYGQWAVYRSRHLLVLTEKTDPPSYALGKRVAAILATWLPTSSARVARAPYARRVASLISTGQLDVAVVSREKAAALRAGRPPFEEFAPVPLRTLADLGPYLLVCREDFPARHAWLVARTLSEHREGLPEAGRHGPVPVPLHPGAAAFRNGLPLPEKDEEEALRGGD